MILLCDLEANQLEINHDLKVWCLVCMENETKTIHKFGPSELIKGLYFLQDAERIVFHNYIGYDMKVLQFLYPKLELPPFDDTLIMSRLFNPDRWLHSIESYGVECGIAKPEHEDWSQFSDEMLVRCTEDVRILDYVYDKLMKERRSDRWEEALQLEYDVALAHNEQVRHGVAVDWEKAEELVEELDIQIASLSEAIQSQLPMRAINKGEVTRIFKKNGDLYANVVKYFT